MVQPCTCNIHTVSFKLEILFHQLRQLYVTDALLVAQLALNKIIVVIWRRAKPFLNILSHSVLPNYQVDSEVLLNRYGKEQSWCCGSLRSEVNPTSGSLWQKDGWLTCAAQFVAAWTLLDPAGEGRQYLHVGQGGWWVPAGVVETRRFSCFLYFTEQQLWVRIHASWINHCYMKRVMTLLSCSLNLQSGLCVHVARLHCVDLCLQTRLRLRRDL